MITWNRITDIPSPESGFDINRWYGVTVRLASGGWCAYINGKIFLGPFPTMHIVEQLARQAVELLLHYSVAKEIVWTQRGGGEGSYCFLNKWMHTSIGRTPNGWVCYLDDTQASIVFLTQEEAETASLKIIQEMLLNSLDNIIDKEPVI